MPTRLAYRWIRGLVGWLHSPVADVSLNDRVPVEVDGEHELLESTSVAHVTSLRGTPMPLCDQASVQKQADQWADLWHANLDFPSLPFPSSTSMPPTLSGWNI